MVSICVYDTHKCLYFDTQISAPETKGIETAMVDFFFEEELRRGEIPRLDFIKREHKSQLHNSDPAIQR